MRLRPACREQERIQSAQLEASSIAEFGVNLNDDLSDGAGGFADDFHTGNGSFAILKTGTTPLKLPPATDSTPIRSAPLQQQQEQQVIGTGAGAGGSAVPGGIATSRANGNGHGHGSSRPGGRGTSTPTPTPDGAQPQPRTPPSKAAQLPGSATLSNQVTPERHNSAAQVRYILPFFLVVKVACFLLFFSSCFSLYLQTYMLIAFSLCFFSFFGAFSKQLMPWRHQTKNKASIPKHLLLSQRQLLLGTSESLLLVVSSRVHHMRRWQCLWAWNLSLEPCLRNRMCCKSSLWLI
jgi:hypothetical protein